MSELEEPQVVLAGTTEDAIGPESLLEQLRAKRHEIAANVETFLPVTGYENIGLLAKYRLMDRPETEKIAKAVKKRSKTSGDFQMNILCGIIINACEGFYIADGTDSPPELTDEEGQHVSSYDRLARNLGWSPAQQGQDSAQAALYFVFGNNEFAIGNHGIKLNTWFGNTSLDVDQEFLGDPQ